MKNKDRNKICIRLERINKYFKNNSDQSGLKIKQSAFSCVKKLVRRSENMLLGAKRMENIFNFSIQRKNQKIKNAFYCLPDKKSLARTIALASILAIASGSVFLVLQKRSNPKLAAEFKKEEVAVEISNSGSQENLNGEFVKENGSLKINSSDANLSFSGIKEKPEKINLSLSDPIPEDKLKTKIVYLDQRNSGLNFKNATVSIKKNSDEKINAIVTCSDENFDKEKSACKGGWQAVNTKLEEKDNLITFNVTHFSAYAGAYLEIVNVQSNLTQGDDWTVNFRTYGQNDLKIEAVDGTNYGSDIRFESLSCGDEIIPDSNIEKNGNIVTIKNYQCDNETSSIKNKAVTAGRHWLSFSFGETVGAKAHNFACNSGTLNDTCTVSGSNTMNNSDTISGTGSLVVANGGTITSAAGNRFTITMTGNVTVQSGGTISGNATINAVNVTVNSGGTINVNGKGSAAGAGTGVGTGDGAGGAYAGVGGNATAGYTGVGGTTTYGSITAPTDLGSGGTNGNSVAIGGAGGGAIKIVSSGTVTINGSVTADGAVGTSSGGWPGGGGSGGSIWIQAGTLAGAGSVTANGGAGGGNGGAGGGGRIVLNPSTSDTFTGSITVSSPVPAGAEGGIGTIVRGAASNLSDITISSATSWIGNIYNTSGTAGSFTFNSLTINSGITLTADVSITTTNNVTVTGTISGDGLGYPNVVVHSGGVGNGGGGGYGGVGGGSGAFGGTGGAAYGSAGAPVDLGSAGSASGSYGTGGAGGGAIKIVAGGTLTVSGSITANGTAGTSGGGWPGGGGSGGSIWLQAATLAGAGPLSANGGDGGGSGGGGGGGRIAIYYTTKTYSGTKTVTKGTAGSGSADGTIFDLHSVVTAPANGAELSTLSSITGTAAIASGTISKVEVSIKDLGTDGAGSTWYNGSNAFSDGSETWHNASGTTSWTYTAPTWTHNHSYLIRARATDNSSNVESSAAGNTFFYWNGTIVSTSVALSGSYTNLLVTNGASPTIAGNTTVTVSGDLRVKSNSNIIANSTNTTQDSGGVGVIINAGNVIVDSGSTINANGTGYAGGYLVNGSGPGGGIGSNSATATAGGGGYGGAGGDGTLAGGSTYGSITAPTDLGSGGGGVHDYNAIGGAGGGAIKIVSTGTVTVSGSITANGANSATYGGGGGSGGSIWIQAGTLAGSGSVTANGGDASHGSGGGGRIVLDPATSDTFTGSVTVISGSSLMIGQMGTIVRDAASSPADITISSATRWIGNIYNTSGTAGSFTFNSLTINSGITLTASVSITTIGNLSINGTGAINANGQGYPGGYLRNGYGPGAGIGSTSTTATAGGGGYGGAGGSGTLAGGSAYGSSTAPTDLGSGGGGVYDYNHYGGAGGGAIKIIAGGTLTISGSITGNGANSATYGGGGGSGGSIWVQAGTLAGAGSVTANGGVGGHSGGGGGRIAVSFSSITYNGTVTATGGTGGTSSGGNGTITGLSPSSTITAPTNNSYKNSTFTTITGTAISPIGTLSGVQISIKDVTDGTHWYNGSNFTTATSETWLNATGTTSWTYALPALTSSHVYLIRSKAADNTASSPEISGTGNSFTYDSVKPDVALAYDLNRPVKDADTLRVTATFSEVVQDSPIPQIAVSYTGGGSLSATNMTKTDTTHYYYDVNVPSGSDGTATIAISNGQDLAGNTNNAATSNTFTVDNIKPLLSSLALSDPTPTKAGTVNFTLNFSEVMDTSTNPTVTFGTSAPYNQHTAATNGTWTNGNQTFTVGVTIPDDGTWDGTSTIKVSGAKDLANNIMDDNTASTFVVDTTKSLLSSITLSDPTPTKAGTVSFSLDFNESMDTNTNPTVTFGTSTPYNQHAVSTGGTWADSDTFTASINIPDNQTWDGTNTIKVSGAKDLAGNVMADSTANTFLIDTTDPVSSITMPENGNEYWNMSSILATASDSVGVDTVYVSIKDTTDGSHWWSGTDWSVTDENNSWLAATFANGSWKYDAGAAHVTWTVNSNYLIKSKAVDTAGNIEIFGAGHGFTFINAHPVVSNISAAQKNNEESNTGKVEVSYDVTDTESSETVVSLFYDSNATLAGTITNGSSTSSIQTSDSSHFPSSGKIMIKKGTGDTAQYEYIAYTGKSGNNLTGISRSQEGTVGRDHSIGEQIWIKATSVSSNYGLQSNGTGKSIIWDAKADTNFYDSGMSVRIASNDQASSNNIGIGDSASFEFDAKNPTGISLAINNSTQTLTMNTPSEDSSYKMSITNGSETCSSTSFVAFSSPYTDSGLTDDPATVCVRIRDNYGNYADVVGETPAHPTTISFYDVSQPDDNEWREFITWSAIPVSQVGLGFLHYNIWGKEGDGNYQLLYQETDRTKNYYSQGGLETGKTYYYKVTAEDTDGNISGFSPVIYDTPDGQGSSDRTPPAITNVIVASVNTTSAKIIWTTDEKSDSSVGFSIDTTFLPELGNASFVQGDPSNSSSISDPWHSITLTGLAPGTTYNIKIKSRDAKGNLGTADASSPGDNDTSVFRLTTHDGPAISNVTVPSISNNQATISWQTNIDSSSYVAYSTGINENGTLKEPVTVIGTTDPVGGSAPFTHHQTITDLTEGKKYYFYVKSIDTTSSHNEAIDNNGGNFYQITTTLDNKAPVIVGNIEASVISNTGTAIHWVTDEPASSKVEYSTHKGGSYTESSEVKLMDVSHYIILSSLTANTKYYYKVISHDINGHEVTSGENEFTTLKDPGFQHDVLSQISDVADPPSIITDTKAVVTFNTDQAAKCTIEYGTQSATYSEVPVIENDYNINHSIHVTGLIFSTKYYYQISCIDNLDTVVDSSEYSFTTAVKSESGEGTAGGDTTAPSISSIGNGKITGESVTITWKTDEKANSSLAYGIASGTYENGAVDYLVNSDKDNYVTDHSVIINNLTPGTKYYYVVISNDIAGNISTSSEQNFSTSSPSNLSSISVVSTAIGQALVTWSTNSKLSSIVEYGIANTYGSTKSDSSLATDHSISLSGLKEGTPYHFRVKGEDADKNLFSSGDYTFQPKSPPKVSSSNVDSVTEHEAKISVATDIPTDVLITYFDTGDQENTGSQGKPDMTTKHEVDLKNLESGRTYSYTVRVTDEQGNQTTSDTKTFTTGKDENPPEISQIKTDSALAQNEKVQAIISWTTSEPSNTSFIYKEGTSGEEKELLVSDAYTLNHIVVSTVFKSGTVYHFKVKSIDQSGNESVSSDFALLTPKKKENIVQIIVTNFQDIFGWAKLVGGK